MQGTKATRLEDQLTAIQDVFDDEKFTTKALQSEIGHNDDFAPSEDSVRQEDEDSHHSQAPVNKESTRSKQTSTSFGTKTGENDTEFSGGSSTRDYSSSHSSSDRDEVKDDEYEHGGKAEIKHLYETREKNVAGETIYSTKVPIASGIQQKLDRALCGRDEARDFAILHYHNATLQTDFIVVQSPELKNCLADILSGCVDIDAAAPTVELRPPFMGLVQRWDRLLFAEKTIDNEKSKGLLHLLRETLETELHSSFQAFNEVRKTGYTTFTNILMAFVPGEIVLRSKDGVLSAGILQHASIEKEFMGGLVCILRVQVLDWNGKTLGYREKTWKIESFQGFRKATDLDAFPLAAHPDQEKLKKLLTDRGRAFEGLCGQHTKNYNGLVHLESGWERKTIFISERIIVDASAFYRFQHHSVPDLTELESEEGKQGTHPPDSPSDSHTRSQQQTALTEKQCMLAVPRVKGFALSMKKWFEFAVSDITPITWNEKLLGNLVIPDEEKQLLLALVAHTAKEEDGGFDDFIEGKGKGLILLLAGPPGVGKTLTAESVAEELKRPLYRVGAGDLGLSADDVESSLKEAFRRCSHWNAVLLIDEADVFLEKRSSDRLAQNELVSVFLTLLEYYQGVLILTTNRTEKIDPAFESRIDIILTYDHLSQDARKQIWSNFISRLPPGSVGLDDADLDNLSRWDINGRQIKSAIKTARIMAANEGAPLGVRHLDIVLNIRRRGSKVLGTQG
ncbi:AAA domain-containing protein [Fusarium falciforme]|uniref:AAA domain-containing protein n=1 Tax=Fusarium falciforme TaxID=195108 RepID=UPI002300A73D|nr:AAA domain-containing protein [Fusarium falciforme]WAO93113.1 AAA domain-containing protein [Fusarium falciforme]